MDSTIASLPGSQIRLRDGRRLAYAEYGDPQGKPIFFFHGTPGSRLFHHPDNSVAASAGARIIAVDRPGFGRSDFKPARTLLDWPGDVLQLADALNIDRFAVLGYSGGGPYAAACASAIPDRLTAAGLVSSVAPLDNPQMTRGMHGMLHTFFALERHIPPLAKVTCRIMCSAWRMDPDLYFKAQLNGLYSSREAENVLPVMKDMLMTDLREALRSGTDGIAQDMEILAQPWGFALHVILTEVFLWHGEEDTQAPSIMGKRLAAALPRCRAMFFPGEGHWVIFKHWQEILTALVQAGAPQEVPEPVATVTVEGTVSEPELTSLTVNLDTEDTPTELVQGLQPTRDTCETVPPEAKEPVTIVVQESPVAVPSEAEPPQPESKPARKGMAKRYSVAKAEAAGRASRVEATPEIPVSKALPKKADRRRTAAKSPPSQTSSRIQPRQANAKAAPARTTKRAKSGSAAEPKPLPNRASSKKTTRPKAATVKRPPIGAAEEVHVPLQEPQPAADKPSKRRADREAVLV
ncbi:MAG: alpha/beta fold hydrolase [Dehalococcoidia bacterium]|nr:alpha/beta fold hydrolase [Dehalococcoidia bacterium]